MERRQRPNWSYPSAFDPSLKPEQLQERIDRHYALCTRCTWDAQRCLNDPEYCVDFEEIPEPKNQKIALIAAIVFVIILIILLLCRTNQSNSGVVVDIDSGEVGQYIETLDRPIYSGTVSVWVKPDGKIDAALQQAGLAGAPIIFTVDDLYVIEVPEGDESKLITRLKASPEVVDAGYVYQQQ